MKNISLDTTYDRIFHSYRHDHVKLTANQEEIKKRWEAAYSLMVNYHSREQAIPMLRSKFEISVSQAHRDINNCLRLFGDVAKSNKEGIRNILYEYSMKTFQLAASCKPPDIGEMNKSISLMIKLKGIDKDDPDLPDFSKLEPHTYIIANDPKTLGFEEVPNIEAEIAKYKKKQALKTIDITDAEITL